VPGNFSPAFLTDNSNRRNNGRVLAVFIHFPSESSSNVEECDGELSVEGNDLDDHHDDEDKEVPPVWTRSFLESHHQSILDVVQAERMPFLRFLKKVL
jgi:hypothetical protein